MFSGAIQTHLFLSHHAAIGLLLAPVPDFSAAEAAHTSEEVAAVIAKP